MAERTQIVRRCTSTGGVEVATYDWGGPAPGAPPLLFVHATGLHAHCYAPVADRLRRTFHCYAVDVRGHGASARPADGRFHWAVLADDVQTAIRSLELDGRRLHAHGHSMGGALCALIEARHPGTFARLFLFEPILPYPPSESAAESGGGPRSNPMAASARRRRRVMSSRAEATQTYRSKPPWDSVDEVALAEYVEHGFVDQEDGTVRLACEPDDEAAVFESSNNEIFLRLDGVRCPVTVAHGAHSGPMMAHLSTTSAAALPFGRSLRLEDRTHFGPFEDVEGYAGIVEHAFAHDPPESTEADRRVAREHARSKATAFASGER